MTDILLAVSIECVLGRVQVNPKPQTLNPTGGRGGHLNPHDLSIGVASQLPENEVEGERRQLWTHSTSQNHC